MKILFITSLLGAEYGGAEVSTRLLLESLKAHGHDVQALTTRKHPKDPTLISISLPIEVPKKLVTLGNNQVDYFLSKKIRCQLELIKPDVIHIQDTYILPATVLANKSLKVPSVVTIRNSVLDETWAMMFSRPISTMLAWRNKTIIKALHKIDCIISVSEYIKKELVQRGIDSNKVIPIYNLPPTFKNSETKILNKSNSIIHLFAPGQLESFKGFSVLIKAMKKITKSKPNVHLVIAGDGSQKKALEKLTKKLQLEKYIKFTGKVPFVKLSQLYATCDVVIFPSIYAEPFGRVALEAMYFGKPVIASKVGGIPEVVDQGSGLLVTPDNSEELAKAVLTLIKNPYLRENMGKKGKVAIHSRFSADSIVSQQTFAYEYARRMRLVRE